MAADAFDEMVTGQGALRQHWQPLIAALSELGAAGLADRAARGRQQLEDEGVTYNLYEGPRDSERGPAVTPPLPEQRPWQLDPVPLILSERDWAHIEAGVKQRAVLLDAVLRDFYGPMRLLHEGRYPPALVHSHKEFLRPAARTDGQPAGPMLQTYACELVRGPDGVWRVIADRAQAPAGAGYALQNRRVMSRLFGQAMRECRVRSLSSFFEYWQADLLTRAGASDNPRLTLLTPGPHNEAYFEHIYLARELGATLVEGADLTVRENQVFLKTLAGLEPVDVILRRIDGEWCDPLELRSDSALGVVGLLRAVRHNKVAVCNGIGSGLVESPALQAFLPVLCEKLLGQPLKLPSVATWWCGQKYAREEVAKRFDKMVIRSAVNLGWTPRAVADLAEPDQVKLLELIKRQPGAYVAQEYVTPSLSPGLGRDGLEPQPILLRVHVVADGNDFVVMPGGLARVPMNNDPFRATLQRGGINKDVWVAASDPVPTVIRGTPARQRLTLRRSSGTLQSRVADDLFWLGRNIERADDGARLMRSVLTRMAGDVTAARDVFEMTILGRTLIQCGVVDRALSQVRPDTAQFRDLILAAFAPGRSLRVSLDSIEHLAVRSRQRFSSGMWRVLNHMLGELREARNQDPRDIDRLIDLTDMIIRTTAVFSGLLAEDMTRQSGWRFIDLGRRLERSIHVVRTLSATAGALAGGRDSVFALALELNDSTLTYRRRYRAALQAAPLYDLLLLDGSNPHSLGFQVEAIANHLDALPSNATRPQPEECDALMRPFIAMVLELDRSEQQDYDVTQLAEPLITALDNAAGQIMDMSDRLSRAYFSHMPSLHPFGVGS